MQTELVEIEKSIQLLSATDQVDNIAKQNKILAEQLEAIVRNNEIGEETKKETIDIVKTQATGALLENSLKRSGIEINMQTSNQIAESVKQKWEEIKIQWKNANTNERNAITNETENELKAKYPSLMNTAGRIMNNGINGIFNMLDEIGMNMYETEKKGIEKNKGK